MTTLQEIQSATAGLDTPELLRYLIKERFPREVVVTASLVATSVVVLKMVSEIDPATPIIFCQRPPIFPESAEYRAAIVASLGLTNVTVNAGNETSIAPGDSDHCERMWVHYRDMPGRSFQLLHFNDCLAPYRCWISAVYHMPQPGPIENRVDVDGRLIKINPLINWTKADVRAFMQSRNVPYHKLAARKFNYDENREVVTYPTYNF